MPNLIKLATAITLVLASGVSLAADEIKRVPAHVSFMNACLKSYGEKPDAQTAALGLAMCQCTFDQLPTDGDMTEREFKDAGWYCVGEAEADPEEFLKRYSEKALRLFPGQGHR